MAYIDTLKDGNGEVVYPVTATSAIFVVGEQDTTIQDEINNLTNAVSGKADKNSPALTGIPTAPTAATDTDTTQIATTEFVNNQIDSTNYAASNNPGGAAKFVDVTNVDGTQLYVAGISGTGSQSVKYNSSIYITSSNVLMGAAWNDYAEKRRCLYDNIKPGTCLVEVGNGLIAPSDKKLMKCGYILSDTYGMAIGPDKMDHIPVGVSGRVLAIPFKDNYKIGDVVGSGPNGTVQKMNRLEVILFPDRIIGVVSEIPNYDEWNGVKVCGRIWIKLK